MDPTTNRIVWQVRTKYPLGTGSGLLSTASGLLIGGQSDGNLTIYDIRNGDVLWQFQTGAGADAPVATYEVNGEQYIAILASGNSFQLSAQGDNLWAFKTRRHRQAAAGAGASADAAAGRRAAGRRGFRQLSTAGPRGGEASCERGRPRRTAIVSGRRELERRAEPSWLIDERSASFDRALNPPGAGCCESCGRGGLPRHQRQRLRPGIAPAGHPRQQQDAGSERDRDRAGRSRARGSSRCRASFFRRSRDRSSCASSIPPRRAGAPATPRGGRASGAA